MEELVVGAPALAPIRPQIGPQAPQAANLATVHIMRPAWMTHGSGVPMGTSLPTAETEGLAFESDLPNMQFTSTSGNIMKLTAFPQRSFRGTDIIASATLIPAMGTPVDASNLVFIDPAIFVGAVQVGSTQGPIALSAYANQSFRARTSWPQAGQGTRVYIPLRCAVSVAMGDVIQVSFVVDGDCQR